MRVTTRTMREAVKGWLEEERATEVQAIQLLDALYAGVIDGGVYTGDRLGDTATEDLIDEQHNPKDLDAKPDANLLWGDDACGCLVDTLERIRGFKPTRTIKGQTGVTFALAVNIPFGGTPSNNAWARAAAAGIEDYLSGE